MAAPASSGLRRHKLVPYREAGSRIDEQSRRAPRGGGEAKVLVGRAGQLDRTDACRYACFIRIRVAGREPFEPVRQCLWPTLAPPRASSDRNRSSLRKRRDHPPGCLPGCDDDHARSGDGVEDTPCPPLRSTSWRDGLEGPAENVLEIVAKNGWRSQ
jgi:hypothetical protein